MFEECCKEHHKVMEFKYITERLEIYGAKIIIFILCDIEIYFDILRYCGGALMLFWLLSALI